MLEGGCGLGDLGGLGGLGGLEVMIGCFSEMRSEKICQ